MKAFKFIVNDKVVIVKQSAYARKSYPWGDEHPHYRFGITVESNGVSVGPFSYYTSINAYRAHKTKLDVEEAADALSCLCSDALIGSGSFDDYLNEFGSDADPKAYKQCVRAYEQLNKIFSIEDMSECLMSDLLEGTEI